MPSNAVHLCEYFAKPYVGWISGLFFPVRMQPVGPVAQLVEQRIENPRVRGSIPRQATKSSKTQSETTGFFFWRNVERALVVLVLILDQGVLM